MRIRIAAVTGALALGLLAGCASQGASTETASKPAGMGGMGGMGGMSGMGGMGNSGGMGMHRDQAGMCSMYRQMMAGKSAAEQQAAMAEHMKAMHGTTDPKEVAAHRDMMEKQCAAAANR